MEPSGSLSRTTLRKLEMMCREVVDRSQGQLIDITIVCFGTNDLISYVSQRCSHLKCLKLGHCVLVSSKCLKVVAQNLKKLEELHLVIDEIPPEDIENIGTSCPQLKSFTYFSTNIDIVDEYAMAVARSMPNLHHLCLFGHRMTNKGLEAILDSCPRLESLDIRRCFNIDLPDNLRNRCSKQIKHLMRPNDPIYDPPWPFIINFVYELLYDPVYALKLYYFRPDYPVLRFY
ncbi:putative F-box/LRR-repeat protein 23 [Andrographis paniculata]|uniref:putative F-box/LRR-repeat protein 23 n=1 Tax=Andrographis paniculata TaxID=175694 RepID=UPI0021E90615|nr:putative F-box/LRR-repeat protein 23 [Andrographis paniculata]